MWPLRRHKHLCGETGKSCSKKESTTSLYLVPDKSCWLLAQVCNLCLANFTFTIISFW